MLLSASKLEQFQGALNLLKCSHFIYISQGSQPWFLTIREEYSLGIYVNRFPRWIYGPKRKEVRAG
jgi:hypothetical protein